MFLDGFVFPYCGCNDTGAFNLKILPMLVMLSGYGRRIVLILRSCCIYFYLGLNLA